MNPIPFDITVTINMGEGEVELEVIGGRYSPATKSTWNPMTGEGDPEEPLFVDFKEIRLNGQAIELSDEEEKEVLAQICDQVYEQLDTGDLYYDS